MAAKSDGTSFYFFDFDDNIMFLGTSILIRNTDTKKEEPVTTRDFADIHPLLGKPGKWENYATFDGSFRYFRDRPASELEPGQKQYFVADVEKAVDSGNKGWKAPSWDLFVYACEKQRPVSIVTARGHSPETLKAGVRVLVDKGLLPREPNYHTVYPVGNDDVRREQLGDRDLQKTVPALKRIAIHKSVDKAMEKYGSEPAHRFGMSDDDPQNVYLVIRAMCDCKKKYPDKRFFVINTHEGEKVKLEVFPVTFPVAGRPGEVSGEPYD